MIKFNKIGKLVAAAVLAMSSSVAMADHVTGLAFSETSFTINPSAIGETGCNGGTCTARFIDFSYTAEVDQTKTGPGAATFNETGAGFFGTFREELNGAPIDDTGLGVSYRMYFVFDGTGTTVPGGGGAIDGTFNTFNYTIFVDRDKNTTLSSVTAGGADQSISVTGGNSDDVAVLQGTLVAGMGGFHIFGGLANGDFNVQATADTIGGFFGGAAFASGNALTDINGVNSRIVGIPSGDPFATATDIVIPGSGNVSFEPIPEPASLALFGLALAGVAFSRRGKKA